MFLSQSKALLFSAVPMRPWMWVLDELLMGIHITLAKLRHLLQDPCWSPGEFTSLQCLVTDRGVGTSGKRLLVQSLAEMCAEVQSQGLCLCSPTEIRPGYFIHSIH